MGSNITGSKLAVVLVALTSIHVSFAQVDGSFEAPGKPAADASYEEEDSGASADAGEDSDGTTEAEDLNGGISEGSDDSGGKPDTGTSGKPTAYHAHPRSRIPTKPCDCSTPDATYSGYDKQTPESTDLAEAPGNPDSEGSTTEVAVPDEDVAESDPEASSEPEAESAD